MSEKPRVLLDSSALIAIIKDEPNAEHVDGLLDMLARGEVQMFESVIILAEVFKPSDHKDQVLRDQHDAKLEQIRSLLLSREVALLDVTPPIVREATKYRLGHRMRLADALHLATAVLNGCDWLVTYDKDFPQHLDGPTVVRFDHVAEPTNLPWRHHVEDHLFSMPASDNVINMP